MCHETYREFRRVAQTRWYEFRFHANWHTNWTRGIFGTALKGTHQLSSCHTKNSLSSLAHCGYKQWRGVFFSLLLKKTRLASILPGRREPYRRNSPSFSPTSPSRQSDRGDSMWKSYRWPFVSLFYRERKRMGTLEQKLWRFVQMEPCRLSLLRWRKETGPVWTTSN